MVGLVCAISVPPHDGEITPAWTNEDPFPAELVSGRRRTTPRRGNVKLHTIYTGAAYVRNVRQHRCGTHRPVRQSAAAP
jgi:hypothetical protein